MSRADPLQIADYLQHVIERLIVADVVTLVTVKARSKRSSAAARCMP
jgi:hypothetical protein